MRKIRFFCQNSTVSKQKHTKNELKFFFWNDDKKDECFFVKNGWKIFELIVVFEKISKFEVGGVGFFGFFAIFRGQKRKIQKN
jgi:hypothetical protein